eukprot:COSAG03_NODE_4548_length_1512_cov_2.159943_1_plen_32_part_10
MYGLPPDSVLLIDRAMYGRQVLRVAALIIMQF